MQSRSLIDPEFAGALVGGTGIVGEASSFLAEGAAGPHATAAADAQDAAAGVPALPAHRGSLLDSSHRLWPAARPLLDRPDTSRQMSARKRTLPTVEMGGERSSAQRVKADLRNPGQCLTTCRLGGPFQ